MMLGHKQCLYTVETHYGHNTEWMHPDNTHLREWGACAIHGNDANSLVDLKIQDEDLPCIQQQDVVTAGLVKAQLQALVQGNTLLFCSGWFAEGTGHRFQRGNSAHFLLFLIFRSFSKHLCSKILSSSLARMF